MAVDLTNAKEEIITGNDNIVIVNHFDGLRGGRALDVTGFNYPVIRAGHVIIQDDSSKKYKPMPLSAENTYDSLPGSHTYVGILVASIPTSKPFAAIMTRGTINPKAAPNDFATIKEAFHTAVPLIDFQED